jgi:hypothetical protein
MAIATIRFNPVLLQLLTIEKHENWEQMQLIINKQFMKETHLTGNKIKGV